MHENNVKSYELLLKMLNIKNKRIYYSYSNIDSGYNFINSLNNYKYYKYDYEPECIGIVNLDLVLQNNYKYGTIYNFNYFKLIKKCKLLGYTKNQIIQFILRFKILGDKIQAMEAKSKCYLKNVYDSSDEDIKFNKRVLITEDRMLLGLCLMESDVSFISKMTINSTYILFWNFIF